mmetsp:Transcript_21843/g.62412  ORF Transcript_21843/g.62412 Transcript_21843/m.62412 type:complete len:294 (+) Transcript_21843:21-902(+)
MADDAGTQLEKAIAAACEIPTLPAHKQTADMDADAFELLRAALYAVKKDEAALGRVADEDMLPVFGLIARRGTQKKAVLPRAKECLGILIANPMWLRAAQSSEGMLNSLKDLAADNPALLQRLSADPGEVQVLARPRRRSSVTDAEVLDAKADVESKLLNGRKVMASYGFRFPKDPVSESLDRATDAFMQVFEAITRLGSTVDKTGPDCSAGAILNTFQEKDFDDLMWFFLTMYESGIRNTFKGRIRHVVNKLDELCPAFREVSAKKEWGDLCTEVRESSISTMDSCEALDDA